MIRNVVVARSMLGVFVLGIIGLASWAWQQLDETVPMAQAGRKLDTPIVHRGDYLVVANARVANSHCIGWIYRQVTDANDDLVFAETDFRPPSSMPTPPKSVRRLLIPKFASTGQARYDVTIQWSCNLMQRIFPVFNTLPTLTFQIVE